MGKLKVPSVTFQTRQNDEWVNVISDEYFKGKKVVVFSLPGAFNKSLSLSGHTRIFKHKVLMKYTACL